MFRMDNSVFCSGNSYACHTGISNGEPLIMINGRIISGGNGQSVTRVTTVKSTKDNSPVVGDGLVVNDANVTVLGDRAMVNGCGCKVYGNGSTVNGASSLVVGDRARVNGCGCEVYGNECEINSSSATVYGHRNRINGSACSVFGNHNKLMGRNCTATGRENTAARADCHLNDIDVNLADYPPPVPPKAKSSRKVAKTQFTTTKRPKAAKAPKKAAAKAAAKAEKIPGYLLLPDGDDTTECADADKCVICLTNRRQLAPRECSHLCLCFGCARTLIDGSQPAKCPVCRVVIQKQMIRVLVP